MTLKASADRSFFEQDGRVSVGRLGAHKKTWLIGVERSESTWQEPIYSDGVLDLVFFPSHEFKADRIRWLVSLRFRVRYLGENCLRIRHWTHELYFIFIPTSHYRRTILHTHSWSQGIPGPRVDKRHYLLQKNPVNNFTSLSEELSVFVCLTDQPNFITLKSERNPWTKTDQRSSHHHVALALRSTKF